MGMSALLTSDSLRYYLTDEPVMGRPTGWELALHFGPPGIGGTGNEVADLNYARQMITMALDETEADKPYAYNVGEILFPVADDTYVVSHVTVWDTGGNLLIVQSLRAPKTILADGQARIADGEIRIGAL